MLPTQTPFKLDNAFFLSFNRDRWVPIRCPGPTLVHHVKHESQASVLLEDSEKKMVFSWSDFGPQEDIWGYLEIVLVVRR